MITIAQVLQHSSDITSEMIGRAHKVFGPDNKAFYQVESSQDCLTEYNVTYSAARGFQCSCKSGQYGFANVRHASGVCVHVRIALATAQEEKAALQEQALLNAQQAVKASIVPVVQAAWGTTEKREFNQIYGSRERGRCAILEVVAMARC